VRFLNACCIGRIDYNADVAVCDRRAAIAAEEANGCGAAAFGLHECRHDVGTVPARTQDYERVRWTH
jgi:hypothetical protein